MILKHACEIIMLPGLVTAPGHENRPDVIVDGRLRDFSAWCKMCVACHALHGVGFGTGKGQKFKQVEVNGAYRLQKLEG